MKLNSSILALMVAAQSTLATVGYGTSADQNVAYIDGNPCRWNPTINVNDSP